MRADRLLSILLLLQIHGAMTAEDLARRLEVSKRTVYRDIEALSMAGIPVNARPGAEGGVWLDEDYRFSLNRLTRDDIQSLAIAGGDGPLGDLGLARSGQNLTLKLLAALPGMLRADALRMRQRVYIDPQGWFEAADPAPLLPALQKAVWDDQVVALTYQHGDGALVERQVEAWSLVSKGNAWYLLGRTNPPVGGEGELRTYRVARVQRAEPTGQCFERPTGFDLPAYWQAHSRTFTAAMTADRSPAQAFEALLRVREPSLWLFIKGLSGRYQREEGDDPAGWLRLRVHFSNPAPALMRVLSLGADVEVLAPPAFRARVIQAIEAMRAHYE